MALAPVNDAEASPIEDGLALTPIRRKSAPEVPAEVSAFAILELIRMHKIVRSEYIFFI
jgi:hypothetical protein